MKTTLLKVLAIGILLIAFPFRDALATSVSYSQSKAVLFLSLGLPDNQLQSYFEQAKKFNIPIVIRGLYPKRKKFITDDDIGTFKDTADRLKAIFNDESKRGNYSQQGVSIDPVLFSSYKVTTVPALVISDNIRTCTEECAHNEYTIIYGNLPLYKLIQTIKEKTTSKIIAKIAENLLKE